MSIYRHMYLGAGIVLLAVCTGLLAGCSSVAPLRPLGNLGDSVNSAADDFAPVLRPGMEALYFTSNRNATEDIWRSGTSDLAGARPVFAAAEIDRSDISLLSQPTTNDGAVAFITPSSGFFASGHAPDSLYAQREGSFGGIVGGTDLFSFTTGPGGTTVQNLGPGINSIFWDSHPAAASRGDSLLLIFSSDRPTGRYGYGSPYREAITLRGSGDSVKGNADLYYVFRIGGRWGEVRNFNDVGGDGTINSKANEYSPYLYCVDHAPRLLFASNRGGSFDLWEAELLVDFARGTISAAEVRKLPSGADDINSAADELFPFMTEPAAEGGGQYLYFASNRDNESRRAGSATVRSAGGFDLYRFPFVRECRVPRLRYEVTVLDAENPSRPVLGPLTRLHRASAAAAGTEPEEAPIAESHDNPAVFDVEMGADYRLYGGSAYNEIHCDAQTPAIESYSFLQVSHGTPDVRKRVSWEWRDTVERGRRVVHIDTLLRVDTVPFSSASSIVSTPGSTIQSIVAEGHNLIVTRMELARREETIGGVTRKYKAQVVAYDTLRTFDSIWIPTTRSLSPSERVRRYGTLALPAIAADVMIRDTVYVYPKYYQAPPCEWLYTRSILDEYRKNVPYFQTAFWEVNTRANLKRDLRKLADAQFADAGFVELHRNNLYFGDGTGRRTRRIGEYEEFARTVDRNLSQMASEVAEQIIPEFIEYNAKTPGSNNKLVVQVLAYSDVRPIVRGQYIGDEPVRYVAGSYDSSARTVNLYNVEVAPGASLISESNDTLSKLRVYYGYTELMERLQKYPAFMDMVEDGTILLPVGLSPGEYRSRMEKAKILVLMEGRYADRSEQPSVSGYTGRGRDFYMLDDVRRMDVRVNRLEYINGQLMKSPCCTDTQRPSQGE